MLDIVSQPGVMIGVAYCVYWMLLLLVSRRMMINLPTALYDISRIYFCCPHNVPAKALKMLFLLDTSSAT